LTHYLWQCAAAYDATYIIAFMLAGVYLVYALLILVLRNVFVRQEKDAKHAAAHAPMVAAPAAAAPVRRPLLFLVPSNPSCLLLGCLHEPMLQVHTWSAELQTDCALQMYWVLPLFLHGQYVHPGDACIMMLAGSCTCGKASKAGLVLQEAQGCCCC
jgi:hypothetical protein